MSGLQIKLTTAGRAAIVNAENTGTAPVRIAQIGVTAQAFVPDPAMGALPGELKRLGTFAGAAVADDTIHVTIRDDSADAYGMRGFGLYLEGGTLFAVYGQADVILEKSTQAMLLLAADIRFADIDATSLSFGDTDWINPPATTTTQGVVELATNAEAEAGADTERAVPPAALKYVLDQRFGEGAPSVFVKSLLSVATAALLRTAIGLGNAALRNEGANNGLDADKLDGQHGAYYLDWANLTGKPATFAPSAHRHAWSDLDNVPATASRWPAWLEVTDKPAQFPPSAHTHAAADVTSGVFDVARIPDVAIAKVTGLSAALDTKASLGSTPRFSGLNLGADNDVYFYEGTPNSLNLRVGPSTAYRYFGFDASGNFAVSNGDVVIQGYTAWHSGSFNPATKLNKAGDTMTGTLIMDRAYGAGGWMLIGRETSGGATDIGGIWRGAADVALINLKTGSFKGVTITDAGQINLGFTTTVQENFFSATANLVLGTNGAGGGGIYLRPNGIGSAVGQLYLSTSGALQINGSCNASGGFDFGSSRKLKEIDGPLPYGLAEVRRIATLVGRYKPDYNDDGRRRLFFDAEQFMGVMPEVVDPEGVEFNGERVPSIKLDQVMPPAYRAIAELADLVDALREEIAALKGGA